MTRAAQFNPIDLKSTVRQLVSGQITTVSFTTPAITGSLAQIQHDLGRIPLGYLIAKGPYMTFQHGWNLADTAWTDRYIYLRFSVINTPLVLAVF